MEGFLATESKRAGHRLVVAAGALLLQALMAAPLAAQTTAVTGRVSLATGRGIPAAFVALRAPGDTLVRYAAETDELGRFRVFAVERGSWDLAVSRIGFTSIERRIEVPAEEAIEVVLEELAVGLPGLAVVADRERANFERSAGATARELNREEMKRIPGIAEADVLRAIELLPGVVTTSDYSSAFNVRGGSADQNLILLDGLPIYNPFHLGGLFSVFNADMVARAELLAGGFPAEYGGRIASVLNVESDGSGAGTDWDAGLSLLAARLSVGTDIPTSIANGLGLRSARARVSARRSYFDVLLRPFVDFPYHLTDVQAYVEGWTDGGSRLSLTAYTGRDVLDLSATDSFPLQIRWDWGNDVIGVRLTHPMANGASLDAHAGYSRFTTGILFPDFGDTDFRSRIDQWLMRAVAEFPLTGALRLRTGFEANRFAYHNRAASGGTVFRDNEDDGVLAASHVSMVWAPGNWLMEIGGRVDRWSPGSASSIVIGSPRVALKRFIAGRDAALKLAVGRYTQFLHSLRDEELPIGLDIWVLSGARAPDLVSDQIQGGVEGFFANGWSASLEAYYRDMEGVATNNFADDPNDDADDLVAGTGSAYGADLYVRRGEGRVRPALAVSWLRARRAFVDPTLGLEPPPVREYAPIFDRRLDIEFTLQTTLPRGIEAGLRWNLGTGLPFTQPAAGYTVFEFQPTNEDGRYGFDPPEDSAQIGVVPGSRNAQRYPAYHRLDVSFRKPIQRPWGRMTPYVDILNLYNRRNTLFYFYEFDRAPPVRSGISMFPLLPTIGFEVSF